MNDVLHRLLPSLTSAAKNCRAALSDAPPPAATVNSRERGSIEAHLDTALLQAREVIWHAQHIVSLLLNYRNASPAFLINKLPDEILSMIFVEASRNDSATMFLISHTCTRWRRLALRTAEMWSTVDIRAWVAQRNPSSHTEPSVDTLNSRLVKLVMERSGHTKMAISHFPEGNSPWVFTDRVYDTVASLNLIQLSLHRLVKLDIAVRRDYIVAATWLEDIPAPVLQNLSIRLEHMPYEYRPFMLKRLFTGTTPQLQHLRLQGLRLPWNMEIFPSGLTTLFVDEEFDLWDFRYYDLPEDEDFEDDDDDDLSIPFSARLTHPRYSRDTDLLSVLELNPNLVELAIRRCTNIRCSKRGDDEVERSVSSMFLHDLRHLDLYNSVVDCTYLLESLTFPQLDYLAVHYSAKTGLYEDNLPTLRDLPPVVFETLFMMNSLHITPNSISGSFSDSQHSGPDKANISIDLRGKTETAREGFQWRPRFGSPRTYPANVLSELIDLYSEVPHAFQHIRRLCFAFRETQQRSNVDCSHIEELLRRTDNVCDLALHGFSMEIWEQFRENLRQPVFRHIRSLELERCVTVEQVDLTEFASFVVLPSVFPSLHSVKVLDLFDWEKLEWRLGSYRDSSAV